ncbi:MAG: phosphatidylglycerophosphatase A [Sphingomonadales bacterium]
MKNTLPGIIWPWKGAARDPAFWIATWGASGLIPKAPGTWGSLAALVVGYAVHAAWGTTGLAIGAGLALAAGMWASARYMEQTKSHDPGAVVIDEVVGMWIALLALPAFPAVWHWAAAFVLFRIFDILKPWPIGVIDRHAPGAWGVMMDDVVAGIFAAAILWGLIYVL